MKLILVESQGKILSSSYLIFIFENSSRLALPHFFFFAGRCWLDHILKTIAGGGDDGGDLGKYLKGELKQT